MGTYTALYKKQREMYKKQLFLETALLYWGLKQIIITLGLKGPAPQLLALGFSGRCMGLDFAVPY